MYIVSANQDLVQDYMQILHLRKLLSFIDIGMGSKDGLIQSKLTHINFLELNASSLQLDSHGNRSVPDDQVISCAAL